MQFVKVNSRPLYILTHISRVLRTVVIFHISVMKYFLVIKRQMEDRFKKIRKIYKIGTNYNV